MTLENVLQPTKFVNGSSPKLQKTQKEDCKLNDDRILGRMRSFGKLADSLGIDFILKSEDNRNQIVNALEQNKDSQEIIVASLGLVNKIMCKLNEDQNKEQSENDVLNIYKIMAINIYKKVSRNIGSFSENVCQVGIVKDQIEILNKKFDENKYITHYKNPTPVKKTTFETTTTKNDENESITESSTPALEEEKSDVNKFKRKSCVSICESELEFMADGELMKDDSPAKTPKGNKRSQNDD
eukprot:UN22879